MNHLSIQTFDDVTAETIINYLKSTKQTRQREVLCELRGIFRYLEREDLTFAISGIHAPHIKRMIPALTDDELQRIKYAIKTKNVSKRDGAMVINGLSCGIRACNLIKL